MRVLQRMQSPAPFGAGVLLHQEEREQEQNCAQLLVVQLDGKTQRELNHDDSMNERPLWPRATAGNRWPFFGGTKSLAAVAGGEDSFPPDDALIRRAGDCHWVGVVFSQPGPMAPNS